MNNSKSLTFYLPSPMRDDAEAGRVNIINRISNAVAFCGFESIIKGDSEIELLSSANEPGYSMFLMDEPFHPRALTLRRAYHYPFWRIESSAKRWEWEVANAPFQPDEISSVDANRFVEYWCERLTGRKKAAARNGDYIYVPLQGRLLSCRSFQAESPIDMLAHTLKQEPETAVNASLHPKENYIEEEFEALIALQKKHPNLDISMRKANQLLEGCKYIVTQNSSVVLDGFFNEIPAVLFSRIDFQHIAANVHGLGVVGAFAKVRNMTPSYSKYLYWFYQKMSVNAGQPDAEMQILETIRRRGWNL